MKGAAGFATWAAALLALALALPAPPAAAAARWRGVVTYVTDGDTLWVRPSTGGKPVEIRLLDLDAPENCQRFGPEARRALAQRVLRKNVLVRTSGEDDYQRVLARVQHRREDVGAWLVREGHAWATGFRGRPSRYAAQQAAAQGERRGLWAVADAQTPRSFRRSHGRCH